MTARLPQLAAMKDECESQSSLLARCNSVVMMADTVMPGLERRLKAQLLGDVAFDAFTRGRYATDASHYQIMPIGVVAPRSCNRRSICAIAAAKSLLGPAQRAL